MFDAYDLESVVKASHAADILVEDLGALVKSPNPLLAEIAIDILGQAVQTQQRLNRIALLAGEE